MTTIDLNDLHTGDAVRCYGDHHCAQLTGEIVKVNRVNIQVRSYYNPGGLQEPIEMTFKVAKTDIKEVKR